MSNTNRFLSDYVYLAEASYSDFWSANTDGGNYTVEAHFEDHNWVGFPMEAIERDEHAIYVS